MSVAPSPSQAQREARRGALAATAAYLIWGTFPIYFKQLPGVPALEVVAHRTVWSLLFIGVMLLALRRWRAVLAVLGQPRLLARCALSAGLLAFNWLVYVWAVQNGHVLDASLGYFINPLVNVALGYLVLHERPRPLQWAAVGLAVLGVAWLTLSAGQWPWVALGLALSFGFYGLARKTVTLGALDGLAVETLCLAPLAVLALVWWSVQGHSAFVQGDAVQMLWLLGSGPLTVVALLLFASGARRITLTTLGLLQYIAPSMVFLLGWGLYGEPVTPARLAGFALIWAALVLYSLDGLWRRR